MLPGLVSQTGAHHGSRCTMSPAAGAKAFGDSVGRNFRTRPNQSIWSVSKGLKHASQATEPGLERLRYPTKLRVVREARMEEGLGVGQSAYFWGCLLRGLRDFPLPERSGWSRQEPGQDDFRA